MTPMSVPTAFTHRDASSHAAKTGSAPAAESACAAARNLSDDALINRVVELLAGGRRLSASLLAHLAEVDARRLYLGKACGSMYAYCTQRLGMDDGQAYKRIAAARVARRYPQVFELVAAGQLHLTTITVLGPRLDDANADELLTAARGKTKRAVECLIAARFPQPDARERVAKLPAQSAPLLQPTPAAATATSSAPLPNSVPHAVQAAVTPSVGAPSGSSPPQLTLEPPADKARVTPLSVDRYRIQFTASGGFVDKLRQIQELTSHTRTGTDVETLMDRALTLLLEDVRTKRFAAKKSRKASRRASKRTEEDSQVDPPIDPHIPTPGPSRAAEPSPAEAAATETPSGDGGVPPDSAPPEHPARGRHISNPVQRAVWERDAERARDSFGAEFIDGVSGRRRAAGR